jgi:imidazolonepropionase-like amidohydrolase
MLRSSRLLPLGLLATVLAIACSTAAGAPLGVRTVALVNGTLIDGTGGAPVRDAAVLVRNGRIVAAGPRRRVAIPAGARLLDAGGGTILPGFINAHVHGAMDESTLAAWARAGVTTVRDLGSGVDYVSAFRFRDESRRDPNLARVVAAGSFVTVANGYPTAIYPASAWAGSAIEVRSPADARRKVGRLLRAGADVVKIALESGAIFHRRLPMLSPAEARAIVETAHAAGRPVSAHISVSADLSRALDAGVDDLAHMVVDRAPTKLLRRAAASGTFWVPTLELWHGVGLGSYVEDNLRRFLAAGGKVALGTDYLGAPSVDFDLGMPMHEVRFMRAAGMTPMQIIVAATRDAARVCNLERELGTVRPGKVADMLVVAGDPLRDLGALRKARIVVHDGVVIRDTRPA